MRLAERFEHKFNDRARFWENVEIFPQVDKLDNYVVNFEIGIEAAISKSSEPANLFGRQLRNRPAAGHLKNDVKIVAAWLTNSETETAIGGIRVSPTAAVF